ncbi:alpha/beta hydrolase [Candidatus Daviesbacteria bacterium]|nr:alpha/beta hydrolase [Candidatus Daviesbacteria bacterium]
MYLNVNGQNIYYQKMGKGKNLIILHGWKQDVSSFWGIIDSLKEDFTLWLIDLPGFGRSDPPNSSFNISDYAKSIAEFIKLNKINKPILLGHSVGGNVSIKLAATFPTLIDKLILEDSSGIRPQKSLQKNLFYILAKGFKYLIPNLFGVKERFQVKFYKAIGSDYLNAGDLKETLVKILNEDLISYLPKIQAETLIIWGEKDTVVKSRIGKRMYQLIPRSRMEIIDGVGHFPHLESPERFVHYVKDFS